MCLKALLFPFDYAHVFIPHLPASAAHVLEFPGLFLAGVPAAPTNVFPSSSAKPSSWGEYVRSFVRTNPHDAPLLFVDLDSGEVSFGGCSETVSHDRLEDLWSELPSHGRDDLSSELHRISSALGFEGAPRRCDKGSSGIDLADRTILPSGISYEVHDFLEGDGADDERLDCGAVRSAFAAFFARVLQDYASVATTAADSAHVAAASAPPMSNASVTSRKPRSFCSGASSCSLKGYLRGLSQTQSFVLFMEFRDKRGEACASLQLGSTANFSDGTLVFGMAGGGEPDDECSNEHIASFDMIETRRFPKRTTVATDPREEESSW